MEINACFFVSFSDVKVKIWFVPFNDTGDFFFSFSDMEVELRFLIPFYDVEVEICFVPFNDVEVNACFMSLLVTRGQIWFVPFSDMEVETCFFLFQGRWGQN